MNTSNHLLKHFLSKTAVRCAVFAALLFSASLPLFAQSAEVKQLGVYYIDGSKVTTRLGSAATKETMYCDFANPAASSPSDQKTSPFNVYSHNHSIGSTVIDGSIKWLITSTAISTTSATCSIGIRESSTSYSLGTERCLYTDDEKGKYQTATVISYISSYVQNLYNFKDDEDNKSFVTSPHPEGNRTSNDPYVSSALIEYDQPYPNDTPARQVYPNHCLSLCMDVVCTNYPLGASTYSIAFPIQDISFDVVKYYNNKNIANAQETPAVRTIDVYPTFSSATHVGDSHEQLSTVRCGSYQCSNSAAGSNPTSSDFSSCIGAKYACTSKSNCWDIATGKSATPSSEECKWDSTPGQTACILFNNDGAESGVAMRFCAAWDGNYEHDGEMGKSNGNFAFRGKIATKFPGDGMAVDNIEFETSAAYPGMNQIPIQVDVTNVHTVRSTPSTVGAITKVSAQPYTLVYKLSKDADVRVAVIDGSIDISKYYTATQSDFAENNDAVTKKIVRNVLNWEPQEGEGMKGNDSDKQLNVFANWDGRNENGLLMPAGNYVVSIQAKAQDEWPGVDFSRAVTRQLSLDPLKLTDVQVAGLNKKSTAYATISYVPTEASTVYWEIYTPGTAFISIETDSSAPTGTAPTKKGTTGSLVYRSAEQKSGRMNYSARWDGTCQEDTCTLYRAVNDKLSNGQTCTTDSGAYDSTAKLCKETFTKGSPMPDGNYIYVLWAEVPYNGCYYNAVGAMAKDGTSYDKAQPRFEANTTCTTGNDGKQFTGAKTLKYTTGILEVERGLVGVTIQPVSYSTVGSSPTAYGLDPFIFKYALDRDAQVVASVQNTAGVPVRYLTPQDGTTNVAQQLNTLSWDGRDEQGRMVASGTYMFVVEAHDAMFPAVYNRATSVFPVDMYRVVDVNTTDVYGDSNAKATISYQMSKAMNVQINIYNKDVVIPAYNSTTGEYGGTAAWPPRVCNKTTDSSIFSPATGAVDPKNVSTNAAHACIYVNDKAFNNYPANATDAADLKKLDVRLQPIKTFDRSATKAGEGVQIMEEWDALYFYNPTPDANKHAASVIAACEKATDKTKCPYEMVPDGTYPFFLAARSDEQFNRYYFDKNNDTSAAYTSKYTLDGEPFKLSTETVHLNHLYATDKPVSRINVTRGPVYFLDGSTVVYSNTPQLFNASTGPTFIPPYEINFAVSRASTVEIAIVALQDNVCSPVSDSYTDTSVNVNTERNNVAGQICKFLSTMTIANTGNFDANTVRKAYWDGTDHTGQYVKPAIYEVRLTARNYPDSQLYQSTVKSIPVNANLFQVFDLLEADSYAISQRGADMHIGYQISVPMKVALQIFKPGTTIYDYAKGTLRNPTTGTEVKDINEVLVRSIVGIRPSMTLIDEVWDGRDYAQQEVPDGTYPFRFVTAVNGADIDTVTGEIVGDWASTDGQTDPTLWKINKVADTYQYQNLHKSTIAIGDGRFVCDDWEKTVFFYPNPLNDASKGTLEITKMPVPGTVSIKYFNLAGDLVREGDYTCVDANNYQVQMGNTLYFQPDNDPANATKMTPEQLAAFPNIRNAALRCKWDRTNQHGKKVAHGVYFGLVDFKAQNGREHCQKVVKIIVP